MVFSHIIYSDPLVAFCCPCPTLPDTPSLPNTSVLLLSIIGGEHSSIMHVWRPKDSLGASIVSYHVGPSDQAQVIRLGGKSPHSLSPFMPPLLVTCWVSL